ncbi:MAG: class I SAM-dependent methyltransferase [Stackebrandtia sp.]
MTAVSDQIAAPTGWPDVARVPSARASAAVARLLLRRVAARLPLRVVLPDGSGFGDPSGPRLLLRRPAAFYHRVGAGGLIGFGEAYQAGDFDSNDLAGLMTVMASSVDTIVPPSLQWLRRAYVRAMPAAEDNSVTGAARNISRHYDLSNDLFALFLDETMTYSAAMFDNDHPQWNELAGAQRRKIDRLLDGARVGAGTRLLEIGTGWGELAVRAAERGATVDSITLSQRQAEYAADHVARRGLSESVHIELRDYRELRGAEKYDAIISVEMIEAVGQRYWPRYFAALRRLLVPGGRVGLQAITMRHDRMMAARDTYTWIHKYIFPGGLIPSRRVIERHAAPQRLLVRDHHAFGGDYVQTLRLWRERFASHTGQLESLGFDETFRRTWEFYLAYSQGGFAAGYLDVEQFVLERTP